MWVISAARRRDARLAVEHMAEHMQHTCAACAGAARLGAAQRHEATVTAVTVG